MAEPQNPPPNPSAAAAARPAARSRLPRKWTYIILAVTLLFVMMPFLFWRATWFGRPLSDDALAQALADNEHPRSIQHGLSQLADRIVRGDSGVKRFYPTLIALAANPHNEVRTMDAWVMGQDNTSPEFHAALLRLLSDENPMVRRNAALQLVRFRDASGHAVISAMLHESPVPSPYAGILKTRLKPGQTLNPGTLVAHVKVTENGKQIEKELRADIPGTLDHWLVADGASVAAGQPIAAVSPEEETVWESLRALYFIGDEKDLDEISPYARGLIEGMPPQIAQQAQSTMQEIRARVEAVSSSRSSPSLQ